MYFMKGCVFVLLLTVPVVAFSVLRLTTLYSKMDSLKRVPLYSASKQKDEDSSFKRGDEQGTLPLPPLFLTLTFRQDG
jgi:hypothetical protein